MRWNEKPMAWKKAVVGPHLLPLDVQWKLSTEGTFACQAPSLTELSACSMPQAPLWLKGFISLLLASFACGATQKPGLLAACLLCVCVCPCLSNPMCVCVCLCVWVCACFKFFFLFACMCLCTYVWVGECAFAQVHVCMHVYESQGDARNLTLALMGQKAAMTGTRKGTRAMSSSSHSVFSIRLREKPFHWRHSVWSRSL